MKNSKLMNFFNNLFKLLYLKLLLLTNGLFIMTSEILILTPSAVALAADSAVTIGNRKTYNGVNKLFMLSNDPPMGIMTYNLSDFSNVPFETIIKEFRHEIND